MSKSSDQVLRIAGVMTGTSCDGLDLVAMEFSLRSDQQAGRGLGAWSYPYPKKLRQKVLAAQKPGQVMSLQDFLVLDREIGIYIAETLCAFEAEHPRQKIDVYAVHGQTVAHHPKPTPRPQRNGSVFKKIPGVTLQLGSAELVAVATGKTVISQFRDGDLCAGGQGAPLVPLFHKIWVHENLPARKIKKGVALLNVGGMANFTYIGPRGELLASDTGPGNALIDWAAEVASEGRLSFDPEGSIAAHHPVARSLLKDLLRHPYFKRPFPKSTGRDEFSIAWLEAASLKYPGISAGSVVSTATELTAMSVSQCLKQRITDAGLPLGELIICGGGARNVELLTRIRRELAESGVSVSALASTPGSVNDPQYIEAQAFAYFGRYALSGLPIGGPWTGAEGFGPPGRITPGKNYRAVQSKLGVAKFFRST